MIFETESGSTYEYDRAQARIRRWRGLRPGTERVGQGEWRSCLGVLRLPNGCALIHWRDVGERQECTQTSRIVRCEEPEA